MSCYNGLDNYEIYGDSILSLKERKLYDNFKKLTRAGLTGDFVYTKQIDGSLIYNFIGSFYDPKSESEIIIHESGLNEFNCVLNVVDSCVFIIKSILLEEQKSSTHLLI